MYELHVADKNGKVQQWWINFLTAAFGGGFVNLDIEVSLKEWNADSAIKNNLVDKIIFQNEGDLIWFLLHWS
jgi:hypothetical protein